MRDGYNGLSALYILHKFGGTGGDIRYERFAAWRQPMQRVIFHFSKATWIQLLMLVCPQAAYFTTISFIEAIIFLPDCY